MSNESNFNFAINRLLEQRKSGSEDGEVSTPGPSSGNSNHFMAAMNSIGAPFPIPPFLPGAHQQGNPLFGNPAFMFPGLSSVNKKDTKIDDDESRESKSPEAENDQKTDVNSPPWLNYLNIASQLAGVRPSLMGSKFKVFNSTI